MLQVVKKFIKIFHKGQFLRFVQVGILGTLINLFSLYILAGVIGMYYMIAASISFILSITSNFFFNKKWTFENKNTFYKKLYSQYFLVSILSMMIGLTLLHVLVEFFGMWYFFGQIIAVAIAGVNSFVWIKFWVFKT